VDKELSHAETLQKAQIDENFSRVFRKRKTQDISRSILAAISTVEALREHIATEND